MAREGDLCGISEFTAVGDHLLGQDNMKGFPFIPYFGFLMSLLFHAIKFSLPFALYVRNSIENSMGSFLKNICDYFFFSRVLKKDFIVCFPSNSASLHPPALSQPSSAFGCLGFLGL